MKTLKENDRVKYRGDKDGFIGLRKGMTGTVLSATEIDGWVEVAVNFDKHERDSIIVARKEVKFVGRPATKITALELQLKDRVIVEDRGVPVGAVVVTALTYLPLLDSVYVSGFDIADDESEFGACFDTDEIVQVLR